MQHPTLTLAEKAAWYGVRACQGNSDHTPEVGTQYLSERAGVPRETLSRALRPLWDAGMLRWTGGRDSRSRRRHYTCYLPGQAPAGDDWDGSDEEPDGPIGAPECDERSHKSVTRDHITAEECDDRSHNSTGSESECDERSQSYVTRDHTSLHPYKDQSLPQSFLPSIPSAETGNVPTHSGEAAKGSKQAGEKMGSVQLVRSAGGSPPNPSEPYQPPGLSLGAAIEWGGRVHSIPADVVLEWFEVNELTGWLDRQGERVRRWKPWLLDYWRDRQARQQGKKQRQGRIAHPKPSAPVGSAANPRRQTAYQIRELTEDHNFTPAEIRRRAEEEHATSLASANR